MKKMTAILLAALIVLSCTAALADNMIVHITALCYDTNHVGEKWQGTYYIGDTEIYDGMIVDLDPTTYNFYTCIGEYDSSPDLGEVTTQYNVTTSRLNKGFTVDQYLTVFENKGWYKDYWCEWYVYYTFTPVGNAFVLH